MHVPEVSLKAMWKGNMYLCKVVNKVDQCRVHVGSEPIYRESTKPQLPSASTTKHCATDAIPFP